MSMPYITFSFKSSGKSRDIRSSDKSKNSIIIHSINFFQKHSSDSSCWYSRSIISFYRAAHLMIRQGGSFAAAIAEAYFAADSGNRAKLLAAFGDLFQKFHAFDR